MAVPRLMARAGSFAFITVPERIDSMLGFRTGGSMIAEGTGNRTWNIFTEALSSHSVSNSAASPAPEAAASTTRNFTSGFGALGIMHVKNFGGIFTYVTSRWALSCFTLAIILNRAQIFSAARRRITLTWPLRLALRIAPILLFIHHSLSLLQAMRCQTSPKFSSLRYGKPHKNEDFDFSGDAGLLYHLSSLVLFWEKDADSCLAVDLIPSSSEPWDRTGSLSLLWPLFRSLCLGQFVQTISCAVQGKPLMTETGMSLFEHSLAFAETEAMISNRLGLLWLGSSKNSADSNSAQKANNDATAAKLFTKSEILNKMNAPPEVLLMGLISSLNNLSSHILGVLDMQANFRLINTGIWGLCFMSSFIWPFFGLRSNLSLGLETVLIRFPTVCVVGFIPHLLILFGIIICCLIYSLALLLCFLSPPIDGAQPRSLSDRFRLARENMQANSQLTNIRIDMHEDFYSALLKIGFSVLTIASEAVYLNEGQSVGVAQMTWLEEERMNEIEAFKQSNDSTRRLGVHIESPTKYDRAENGGPRRWRSGYSRLAEVRALKGPHLADSRVGADGVGSMQRGSRYLMAAKFFRGIFWLWVNWLSLITNTLLDKIGIAYRPSWLKLPKQKEVPREIESDQKVRPESLDFWILGDDGSLQSPQSNDVDVAHEMRKRQQFESENWGQREEQAFESKLYDWWKSGGWWGEKDESGNYQAPIKDDDTTSVISMATDTSTDTDNENSMDIDSASSGANTPTQRHPYPYTRSPSPTPSIDPTDNAIDPEHLARLLHPPDSESRNEAHMLAHHLRTPGVTTRSQYRHAQSFADAKLLTSTRYRPPNTSIPPTGPLSPDQEAQFLEQLILSRRSRPPPSKRWTGDTSWRDGAAGMGEGGPQCVVCQSSPRTILAWPCRCLSLCEDCRISLAMNNFGTCVCCRQDVVGFSRLFVP
ncbi:hypothetical protein ACLMJK_003617 [Lecanora helva]